MQSCYRTRVPVIPGLLRAYAAERTYLVSCPRGEGLLCVQGQRIPLRMEASPQEHVLCTTDPREAGDGRPAA